MTINLGYVYPLAVAAGALAVGVWAVWHAVTGRPHIPAAPDNQPGTSVDDLITCRRINALPTSRRKENPQP
ncbi:hypothetical protein [Streptomyces sp. JB150]|uniref:hypothetical protein n=1 Tax=Streptomyces sp. JB150 TaxID=2714844 RepID=UPI0014073A3A|nr:hypothetical protein [Streptomyces sp. JB150]QIJ61452.1 hypothetical protein G7Z13_04925 [Streptomyces sp. JB150]